MKLAIMAWKEPRRGHRDDDPRLEKGLVVQEVTSDRVQVLADVPQAHEEERYAAARHAETAEGHQQLETGVEKARWGGRRASTYFHPLGVGHGDATIGGIDNYCH